MQVTREQREQQLIDASLGVLHSHLAIDLSDSELDRLLGPCVCGPQLITIMKNWRNQGNVIPTVRLDWDDTELLKMLGRPLPYWALAYQAAEPCQHELFAA
jgi:hypothetical protein